MKQAALALFAFLALLPALACDKVEARTASSVSSVASGGPHELAALRVELARAQAREVELRESCQARIDELEAQVRTTLAERLDRERQWLRYTKGIASLGSMAERASATFEPLAEADDQAATAVTAFAANASKSPATAEPTQSEASDARARARRDHEVFLALRSLFTVEQVSGFDLLESGVLAQGCTGPIVLRVLDEHGRPIGSVCADRLRLEASRSARTLTLVLERGYERRGGERIPFTFVPGSDEGATVGPDGEPRTGLRRVVLPDIDPHAWIEALPELFGPQAKDDVADDGHWDARALRATLNQLLREDAAGGYYHVRGFAGVQGSVLRDVQLEHFDRDGRLERKLFADRMQVLPEARGVQILLEDGAQMRGDQKSPFLDGRYRIFLPRAVVVAWTAAGVPGLSDAPAARKP